MINIVLGANFGDEGKGSVVSQLIKESDCNLVVRFNGGHQAGHTVVYNGKRHVFSNIGSGALQGVPTYWSHFCTVHPKGLLNELETLDSEPELIIDPLCPVTTPFDIHDNRRAEEFNEHGSVGVGFGSTIQRHEDSLCLYMKDLKYPAVYRTKLKLIANYYGIPKGSIERMIFEFHKEVQRLLGLRKIRIGQPDWRWVLDPVFEGAQGILLDQCCGFFPHVTRSNTTSQNALELINRFGIKGKVTTNYVTRSYLTRHGNGPLPFENKEMSYEDLTNKPNPYQGALRFAPFNLDLLMYSLECDELINRDSAKNLWVTCLDQTGREFDMVVREKIAKRSYLDILDYLPSIYNMRHREEP